MAENGSDTIRYQEYDENIDITSVLIPISGRFLRYSYKAIGLVSKVQNLDIEGQNPTPKVQNLDIDEEKIKINMVDTIGIINKSSYSNSIKKMLTSIYDRFFNDEFSRSDIAHCFNASNSASSNYVSYLQKLNVVERVKGKGKGKYRFR